MFCEGSVWRYRGSVNLSVPCGLLRDSTVHTGHFKAIAINAALLPA